MWNTEMAATVWTNAFGIAVLLQLFSIIQEGQAAGTVSISVKYISDTQERLVRIRQGATEAAEQGIRLQLLCQLSQGGDPGHGVTWLHNGAALTSSSADVAWAPGAAYNEYVLTIRNVSSSDGGRYECQAGRHASSSFNLHVRPVLTSVSKRKLVIVGHRVDILCAASGYPLPMVQWRKIGQNTNNFRRVEGRGAVNLTINSVIPADAGKYVCSATSPAGTRDTDLTLLIKRQGLQQGSRESLSMLVKENAKGGALIPIQRGEPIPRPRGSTFDLDCHLEPGRDPTVSISWWINGRRFRNKSRAKIIGWLPGDLYQDHQIRFLNFTSHDGGEYMCITSVGNVSAVVEVEATISEVTSDKRIKAGEPILLRCKAAGYPRPEIHWTHLPTGKVVMSKTVNITSAELKDGGEYQCTAQNKHGRTTAKSMVTVSDPQLAFAVSNYPKHQEVEDGGAIQLACAVKGRAGLPVAWFFIPKTKPEQLDLSEAQLKATTTSLVVSNFGASDAGRYTCVVGVKGEQLRRTFELDLPNVNPTEPGLLECQLGSLDCSSAGNVLTSTFLLVAAIFSTTMLS